MASGPGLSNGAGGSSLPASVISLKVYAYRHIGISDRRPLQIDHIDRSNVAGATASRAMSLITCVCMYIYICIYTNIHVYVY